MEKKSWFQRNIRERKLVAKDADKSSFVQIIGFILIGIGVVYMASFLLPSGVIDALSMLKLDDEPVAQGMAIAFFVTMLGLSFAVPSLLEGNDGISTMRIVVFMIVNVICLLLIRIGWDKKTLEDIGLNQYWMGVIAFVFGAKATQTYFESKLAVPKDQQQQRTGMAAVNYSDADIARLAVEQNQQFLKSKFQNIVSVSDTVHTATAGQPETHIIAIYISDANDAGIPAQLEVKMPDGSTKLIATELVKGVGAGAIHINQANEVSNVNATKGSVCCVVSLPDNSHAVVTAGHVFSDGKNVNANGPVTSVSQALIDGQQIGNWSFQVINYKTDVALAKIETYATDAVYKSFLGKNHYAVTNADVGVTPVKLISKMSGTRSGYILDYNCAWDVEYNDGMVQKSKIILIGSTAKKDTSLTVSTRGDSGGCVYVEKTGELLGLILGGNDKFTWVLPLQELFTKNNFNLV